MPSSGLISSSPLLAPKGQLMKKHSTAVLPVLLLSIVVLLASSCEARGLPVHGKARSSSKSHRLPGKDVAATSSKGDGWLSRQMEARHMIYSSAGGCEGEGGNENGSSICWRSSSCAYAYACRYSFAAAFSTGGHRVSSGLCRA